jgi:hypothetical protein
MDVRRGTAYGQVVELLGVRDLEREHEAVQPVVAELERFCVDARRVVEVVQEREGAFALDLQKEHPGAESLAADACREVRTVGARLGPLRSQQQKLNCHMLFLIFQWRLVACILTRCK